MSVFCIVHFTCRKYWDLLIYFLILNIGNIVIQNFKLVLITVLLCYRYYAHIWRRQFRYMPLWYKGERTVKQPVFVSDVASAIVNAIRDPDSAGQVYQAVG